jgi:hypothetical protein
VGNTGNWRTTYGERPPEDLVKAYLARVERDVAQLGQLREKAAQFKSWFGTHYSSRHNEMEP